MRHVAIISLLFLSVCSAGALTQRTDTPVTSVLVLVEGTGSLRNYAMGDGRQLATLLGHFNVRYTLKGVNEYVADEMKQYDLTFYVGFHASNTVPTVFAQDVLSLDRRVFWLNTGFEDFSKRFPVSKRFGFHVSHVDSTSIFDAVRFGTETFTKGEPNLNAVVVSDPRKVTVTATAVSTRLKRDLPYILSSGNLTYIADSPFSGATESDRYLLFADLLHEFLGQAHEESHSALIRIEDVTPLDDPDRLREIADVLAAKGIPFLVGVVPIYVDPGQGLRVSLSDKTELVDALRYMVHNGGTLVMHGVTHQYKGVSTSDFEFWDESTNKPIKNQSADEIAKKLDLGIQEFMKNGLYPLIWETPHYTASFLLYQTVSKYFSTAMEQRLSLEDYDYSQFFPYTIQKDLFGQRLYPETLGYVPLNSDRKISETYIQKIIRNAKTMLAVRDGFASCFFHSFLDISLLGELVDGIRGLGYTYIDPVDDSHWVKTSDRVILTGTQSYELTLQDQYLAEAYFSNKGEVLRRIISEKRIHGTVSKSIELGEGEIYKAEPIEFRPREPGLVDNLLAKTNRVLARLFTTEPDWQDARVAILWNHYARGAAYNDQASFLTAFRSVNIVVDTIFVGQQLLLQEYNLLVAPYGFIDSLHPPDYDAIIRFVEEGGNLITDQKNELAEELGIQFSPTQLRVRNVRDRMYPEEPIAWRYFEPFFRLNVEEVDEVFCQDASTDAPLVIGKSVGKGKVIFFGTRFDPLSQRGTSHYPYLLDYVKRYFRLGPVTRRENLETYFDPGFRHTYSIEDLVKQWVRNGIRRIHVAGWHQYPKYTYDYARLIRLAHANGILVYAWLEPPQVNQMFWTNHPEWREKTYKGDDAPRAWRYAIALTEPACVDSMAILFRRFLESYDWDGVNLAELYFESGKGFETPQLFTPMHPSAIREVRTTYGIELSGIFDQNSPNYWGSNPQVRQQVVEYRIRKLDQVYTRLLKDFTEIAKKKQGFQIIVTAMDSFGSPKLREELGVDMNRILELQKQFGFLLQVEDPQSLWSTDPFRYVQIGQRYERLIGDRSKVLLDLNILSFRQKEEITPFPTLIQTGTESFLLLQAASIGAPRFTFYSEQSVNAQDLPFFASASATAVSYRQTETSYTFDAGSSFILKLPKEIPQIRLDDMIVPASRDNVFFVPAGTHTVDTQPGAAGAFSTSQLQPRILSATGEILSLSYGMREARFTYDSRERMLVSFSNEPTQVTIDGQPFVCKAMKGNDCFTIELEVGHHEAVVLTGDPFAYGVNVTSLWSTTAIAIFGFLAVVFLVMLYVFLKIARRQHTPGERA